MKSFYAFLKKEWLEILRSGKLTILLILFLLFGIMNPAIAKLTPWLLQAMSDSLEASGFLVTDVQVDAMTSWTQFLKNIPMALMAFVLLCSNLFSKEYQSGTLVLILTKGLARYKVECLFLGQWHRQSSVVGAGLLVALWCVGAQSFGTVFRGVQQQLRCPFGHSSCDRGCICGRDFSKNSSVYPCHADGRGIAVVRCGRTGNVWESNFHHHCEWADMAGTAYSGDESETDIRKRMYANHENHPPAPLWSLEGIF